MSDFYLTLPSNACLDKFPDNTLTKFSVNLEPSLALNGKWQVGLTEIQYTNSWHDVIDGEIIIETKRSTVKHTAKLPSGKYCNMSQLIESLHKLMASYGREKAVTIFYDKIINRTFIEIKDANLIITLSTNLKRILGFQQNKFDRGTHKATLPSDISEGFTAMYMYTNIIEPQIVGGALVPLLRVIPIESNDEYKNCTKSFQHVQYLSVVNNRAKTIDILIRRDDGRPVPFQQGKVIVTLHFKQIA